MSRWTEKSALNVRKQRRSGGHDRYDAPEELVAHCRLQELHDKVEEESGGKRNLKGNECIRDKMERCYLR